MTDAPIETSPETSIRRFDRLLVPSTRSFLLLIRRRRGRWLFFHPSPEHGTHSESVALLLHDHCLGMDSHRVHLLGSAPPRKIYSKHRRQKLDQRLRFFPRYRHCFRILDRRNLRSQHRCQAFMGGNGRAARRLAPQEPVRSIHQFALSLTAGICEETIFAATCNGSLSLDAAPIGCFSPRCCLAPATFIKAEAAVVIGVWLDVRNPRGSVAESAAGNHDTRGMTLRDF